MSSKMDCGVEKEGEGRHVHRMERNTTPFSSGIEGEGTGVSKGMLQKVSKASTPAHYIKCLETP